MSQIAAGSNQQVPWFLAPGNSLQSSIGEGAPFGESSQPSGLGADTIAAITVTSVIGATIMSYGIYRAIRREPQAAATKKVQAHQTLREVPTSSTPKRPSEGEGPPSLAHAPDEPKQDVAPEEPKRFASVHEQTRLAAQRQKRADQAQAEKAPAKKVPDEHVLDEQAEVKKKAAAKWLNEYSHKHKQSQPFEGDTINSLSVALNDVKEFLNEEAKKHVKNFLDEKAKQFPSANIMIKCVFKLMKNPDLSKFCAVELARTQQSQTEQAAQDEQARAEAAEHKKKAKCTAKLLAQLQSRIQNYQSINDIITPSSDSLNDIKPSLSEVEQVHIENILRGIRDANSSLMTSNIHKLIKSPALAEYFNQEKQILKKRAADEAAAKRAADEQAAANKAATNKNSFIKKFRKFWPK